MCLELEAGSELHPAEIPRGVGYVSERVVSQAEVGEGEALPVSHVEHFGPDLKLHALSNAELLGK